MPNVALCFFDTAAGFYPAHVLAVHGRRTAVLVSSCTPCYPHQPPLTLVAPRALCLVLFCPIKAQPLAGVGHSPEAGDLGWVAEMRHRGHPPLQRHRAGRVLQRHGLSGVLLSPNHVDRQRVVHRQGLSAWRRRDLHPDISRRRDGSAHPRLPGAFLHRGSHRQWRGDLVPCNRVVDWQRRWLPQPTIHCIWLVRGDPLRSSSNYHDRRRDDRRPDDCCPDLQHPSALIERVHMQHTMARKQR